MVFLEDVLQGAHAGREGADARRRRSCCRRRLLRPALLRAKATPTSLATVIFSSGSTGVPKGVMLTHRNILANVDAIAQVFQLNADDVMVGVLPFFHSFGFTGTLWLPLVSAASASSTTRIRWTPRPSASWPDDYRATMLISTPTFCAGVHPQVRAASSSRTCATRSSAPRSCASRSRRRSRRSSASTLLEGYGCTEMSPVVAVNVPDVDDGARAPARHAGRHRSAIRCRASPPRSSIRRPAKARSSARKGCCSSTARTGCWATSASRSRPREVAARRLVRDRRHRDHRRGRLHPDHRSAVALQQDRRRDGAAHEDRGADPGAPRRRSTRASSPSVPDDAKGERLVAFYTDPDARRRSSCGSGCARPSCRACGCRSARTCASSRRSRRSAPARSTCAPCANSPSISLRETADDLKSVIR